jgi:hypothetical protein
MFELKLYNNDIDLSDFYKEAEKKKFYNNSSQEMLIDYISKYEDAKLWLLLYDKKVVGTVVAHRLRELGILGKDAYRIGARTCVLTHLIGKQRVKSLKGKTDIHYSHASQFLLPACIQGVGKDKPLYLSTHTGNVGSQNKVHNFWAKHFHIAGVLENPIELEYRGSFQTFWKVNVDKFYETLILSRWPEAEDVIPILV